jgi:sec-independent protein translocase protein TatC
MNRIWWWVIDLVSRGLEPSERDTVLGDFIESCEPPRRAVPDLLGLIVRRKAALWGASLLRTLAGLTIAAGISFYFRDIIYVYLASGLVHTLSALRPPTHLIYTNPLDPFILYLKLSIMTGVFLASPYVSWQFWTVSSPDRYRHRKSHMCFFVFFTSTLFVTGGYFAFKLAIPAALRLLLSYGLRFRPMVTINEIWNLTIFVMVGGALLFELPGLCWLVYLQRAE